MAKSLRAPAQSIPFPAPVYHAAVAAGIEAAHAWFSDPVLTAGEYKHDARVKYVGNIIDTHEPGRIPFAAAVNGFGDGFNQGIAQIIAGGASHA